MKSRNFRHTGTFTLGVVLLVASACYAKVDPILLTAPKPGGWVGQRLPFYIELRGEGPFEGAASFSLPEASRCVVVKVGDPVVGSIELEGASWFTQTHEFALFSQRDGDVELPPIAVRFSNRSEPDAPAVDRNEKTSPLTFHVKRPEGAAADSFIVTSADLAITERWTPHPGATKQGAVFHRTITQEASEVTGMALAPPPGNASDGVRVHPGKPSVSDSVNRGELRGRRSDTITYVLEEAGNFSAPAIKYVWWNPDKNEFDTTTLPAVTFEVAAAHGSKISDGATLRRAPWAILAPMAALFALALWIGRWRLTAWWRSLETAVNPLERLATRKLLKACRRNDAAGADAAWLQWRSTQSDLLPLPGSLQCSVRELDRYLYGPTTVSGWCGDELARSFHQYRSKQKAARHLRHRDLPALNPS